MKIVSIGGGPAGLYFSILMKNADPSHDITVIERNRADDTFGFGVVFSDATLGNLAEADPETYAEIRKRFAHWDDIDIFFAGQRLRSAGHGFCGMSRMTLLEILQARCRELGVKMQFETEATDYTAIAAEADLVLAADGVGSGVRDAYPESFEPVLDFRPNRFVWLGTKMPFDAFTFYFNRNQHGLWRVHAYRYQEQGSTFIVECTEETWRRSGMDQASEDETVEYLEKVFAEELGEHRLIKNRSIWRQFPNISCGQWHHKNVVLVGDAVHTAHFSIGSGTKLAMEDCIWLADALRREPEIDKALELYEREWKPEVERLQRSAQVSLEWFENAERYMELEPRQFAFSLLTRSLRVTHENLRLRDPQFMADFDKWFADNAADQSQQTLREGPPAEPKSTPLRLRNLTLVNRLVAAPPPAAVKDVAAHMRARAHGGAGLVMAPAIDAGADLSSYGELAAALSGEQASVGALLTVGHPGYGVPDTPALTDAAGKLCVSVSAAAATLHSQGFDLLELDLSSGLMLELYAEPKERQTLLDVIAAARAAWPAAKPLSLRVPGLDWQDSESINPSLAIELARALREAKGVDLATVVSIGDGPEARLGNVGIAEQVRLATGLPTCTEGGVWSLEDVDSAVAAGRTDLCAFVGDDQFRPQRDAAG